MTGKPAGDRLIHRPSAYFWYLFQSVCALAFFPCLALALVAIIGFHQGWAGGAPGLLAFGSQAGNIGGLVQRGRELRGGYTTIPWLAGEVELRDPSSGRVLIGARSAPTKFTSMKRVREFVSTHPPDDMAAELPGPEDVALASQRSTSDNTIHVKAGRDNWRFFLIVCGIGALVALIVFAFTLGAVPSLASFRFVGYAIGLVGSLVIVAVVLGTYVYLANRGLPRQMHALAGESGQTPIMPVSTTVELFGELRPNQRVKIESRLLLSVDPSELALWTGKRTLTRFWSIPFANILQVESGRAHDTRGNENPAIVITGDDSRRILLFARNVGWGYLWPADDAKTRSAVKQIATAVGGAKRTT